MIPFRRNTGKYKKFRPPHIGCVWGGTGFYYLINSSRMACVDASGSHRIQSSNRKIAGGLIFTSLWSTSGETLKKKMGVSVNSPLSHRHFLPHRFVVIHCFYCLPIFPARDEHRDIIRPAACIGEGDQFFRGFLRFKFVCRRPQK